MVNKKRLKILFIPAWYPSKQNSVAGIFIKEHAKAVSLYNDVIVLYCENIDHSIRNFYKIENYNIEDDIRTLRIYSRKSPIPKTNYFIHLWSIFRGFRKLLHEEWKPDIIHAHVFSAGVPAVILGKIYKIPVVITEHCSVFSRHTLTRFDVLRARFAMNRAKVILPVSKALGEAIKSYDIKNRFEVIPNVANTDIFYPYTLQNRNGKKRILFVAVLKPRKGVYYLIQALAQLKQKRQDFILDIVGDGPNREEYEKLAMELKLNDMVKFHGLKTKSEVAKFMRNSDFFVQPSLYETFGVVYIEAMACGKPIIASQLPVLQEKINKETGILVPPKDTEALADAIEYMLDHYQRYSSEKISEYAKENFSYEVVGKKLNEIYWRIM